MNNTMPDDLITLTRAAKLLHCHVGTVYRWALRGKLRAWRRGGERYLVSEADVRALLVPVEPPRVIHVSPRAQSARDRHTREVLRAAGFDV